ncbi:muscle M-line assembly protein unc-89 isoform X2 [Folsomia candida]|uniref:muscle M-line assembly protein unc-89 isoform X2 n=1 Tax=Folsomia candida TaxID=158441 RepID=UPI000B8F7455|nr:muscle M-line assembly protein unc-89 isoform X2 [Folsomia candida]
MSSFIIVSASETTLTMSDCESSPTKPNNSSVSDPPREWNSKESLLVVAIVHLLGKEEAGMGEEEYNKSIDWEVVENKMNQGPVKTYSAAQCKEQYLKLMRIIETHLPSGSSASQKQKMILKTIADGLLRASKYREDGLQTKIATLVEDISVMEDEIESLGETPGSSNNRDHVELSNPSVESINKLSDSEGSDDSDSNLLLDQSAEIKSKTDYDFICSHFVPSFGIENNVYNQVHLDRIGKDQSVRTYFAYSEHSDDVASVTPTTPTGNSSPFKLGLVGSGRIEKPGAEKISLTTNEEGVIITGDVAKLQKWLASTPTEIEVPKAMQTTGAPTLSKLLELPPRDKNEPLPQINSLMRNDTEESVMPAEDRMETEESGMEGSTYVVDSSAVTSPLQLLSTSPVKILASLGTTTTPVKVRQPSESDKLVASLLLGMAQSGSPLKSMEEIELANDYVMESGLISCQTDDDVDPAVMNIKLVAPPSEEVASVPKKEEPFVVPLSIPVLPLTAKADGEKLEESGDTRNTTPIMSASSPTKTVDEKAEVPDSTTTAASISAITGDVTLNVKNIGGSPDVILTPTESTPKSVLPDEPTSSTKIIEVTRSEDNVESSPEKRGRGSKRDPPSTPVTRHSSNKEKSKQADLDVVEEKQQSAPKESNVTPTTSSRRSTSRSSGQYEDLSSPSKDHEIAHVGKSPVQRRLFRPTTPEVVTHTPNLRSRRGPTPTPGTTTPTPVEEEPKPSGGTPKRSKATSLVGATGEEGKVEPSIKKEENQEEVTEAGSSSKFAEEEKAVTTSADLESPVKEKSSDVGEEGTQIPTKRRKIKERRESGEGADDDNSNSGTDVPVKKRLTRRSMKLVSVRENASPPKEATGDEAGSKLYEDKETKKLHGKATPRLKSVGEESSEKEEQMDGKRVTRARANKTSLSPSRTRTKSMGSNKASLKSDAETSESEATTSSRATRSRFAGSGATTPIVVAESSSAAAANLDSNPNSPAVVSSSTADDEVKDLKTFKKSMLGIITQLIEYRNRQYRIYIFGMPDLRGEGVDEVASYKKIVKTPMDLLDIKRNVENGVIRSFTRFDRDINLMFMNGVMFNRLAEMSQVTDFDLPLHVINYYKGLIEEYKNSQKVKEGASESKKEESDGEAAEPVEEKPQKTPTTGDKPGPGRKRRTRSISTTANQVEETPHETKRRTLRTSTAAATTATTAWQSARQKKVQSGSPDIATLGGRGARQE